MRLFPRFVIGFLAAMAAVPAVAQTVTLKSLLNEMVDRDKLSRYPNPAYTCKQFSSYDRASTSPDNADTWFANGDAGKFLRVDDNPKVEGGREWVMMDTDGPGAVVRFWSANPNGTVRFYFDGAAEPALAVPLKDLLGARWKVGAPLSETVSRGWNLYLPIPYAKHLKVTLDGKNYTDKEGRSRNEADSVYYQINYRTYEASTSVESFTVAGLDAAADVVAHVQDALVKPDSEANDPSPITRESAVLEPRQSHTVELPKGPGAVRYLALGLNMPDAMPEVRAAALRHLVISFEFDGEKTGWCPLSDFFGMGVGHNVYKDWYRSGLAAGYLHARWIMPYQSTGKITITNYGSTKYTVRVNAATKTYPSWDPNSMHFHVAWHYEYPIHAKGGRGTKDWNYIDIKGKGVYVGDSLAIMNPVPDWWGEGDEKIYVDGETFPSHFGTGTEDYYGYVWSSPEKFESAFHAQPRSDGQKEGNTRGHSTVTRSRSLDAIPFKSSFKFDMEVWHWHECDVAYAAATYFYAMPGATTNRVEQKEDVTAEIVQPPPPPPPFKMEGAIECETLKIASKSDGVVHESQSGFGPGLWSGEKQLFVRANKVGDFVELEIPTTSDKPVKLEVHGTKSWDYGIIRFSVDGKQVGSDVDMFNTKDHAVARTGAIDLGVVTPKNGKITLRVEIAGSNPKSEGTKSYFGLDCVILKPAP